MPVLLQQVITLDLRPGDVVVTWGMRVRIDGPRSVTYQDPGRLGEPVYLWPGKVVNMEEIRSAGVIDMRLFERKMYTSAIGWYLEETDDWVVKGDNLANWRVERDGETQ